MNKRKISAKQLVSDVKSGMSDTQLMAKHELTPKGLQSAFSKLVEAGLLDASSLRERGLAKPGPKPGTFEGHDVSPEPAVSDDQKPTELLQAVAYDVKSGLHDSDIMRRYELSPGKLKEMKNELIRLGYLSGVHALGAESKKTKICPFCSQEIQDSAARCVHCGQWLHAGAAGVRTGAPRPEMGAHDDSFTESPEKDEAECPWEDRESYGTLGAFFQTGMNCVLTPTKFFSILPRDTGFLNPVLFGVFSVVMSAVLAYAWSSLLSRGGGGLFAFLFGMIFVIIGAFIIVPIGLFVWSGILHLCLLLVGGANEGYEGTFRVVSYSSVTSLFNAIPVAGTIASLWGIVLTVIGLREVHNTSTGKSVAAVLIPVGFVALLAIGAIAMGAFAAANWSIPFLSQSSQSQTLSNDICTAVEDYIAKIDTIKEQDPVSAPAQARQAMTDLEEVLSRFEGAGNVGQIRQAAQSYGGGVIAQISLKRTLGEKAALSKLDHMLGLQRKALSRMCGK